MPKRQYPTRDPFPAHCPNCWAEPTTTSIGETRRYYGCGLILEFDKAGVRTNEPCKLMHDDGFPHVCPNCGRERVEAPQGIVAYACGAAAFTAGNSGASAFAEIMKEFTGIDPGAPQGQEAGWLFSSESDPEEDWGGIITPTQPAGRQAPLKDAQARALARYVLAHWQRAMSPEKAGKVLRAMGVEAQREPLAEEIEAALDEIRRSLQ